MKHVNQMFLALILGLLVLNGNSALQADPAKQAPKSDKPADPPAKKAEPDGPPTIPAQFMSIESPVGEVTYGRVTNAALALMSRLELPLLSVNRLAGLTAFCLAEKTSSGAGPPVLLHAGP